MMGESALLTALGRSSAYQRRQYTLEQHEVTSRYAPAALLACLASDPRLPWPNRIIVLVTPEAQQMALPDFEAELSHLAEQGWPSVPALHAVAIDTPIEADGLWQQFHRVVEALAGVTDLVLDVTHGFRSLPLTYWAAAHYRRALDDALVVHHVYYAALEAVPKDASVPFVDLTPLVSLPDWSYAVRAWNQNGRLGPLRDLVQNRKAPRCRNGSRGDLAGRLRGLSNSWDNGLPLDVEIEATGVVRRLREPGELLPEDPLASKLLRESLLATLTPWELPSNLGGGKRPKKNLVLDEEELRRELKMAQRLVDNDALAFAVGIAREWIINYVLWSMDGAPDWLDPQKREVAGNILSRGWKLYQTFTDRLSSRAVAVIKTWKQVRDIRNQIAHHGFNKKDTSLQAASVHELLDTFGSWLDGERFSLPAGKGRILLTPLGMSPGALYTVLRQGGPFDGLVVVASPQTVGTLDDCLSKVPHAPPRASCQCIPVDPYAPGRNRQCAKKIAGLLVDADEVAVNLTGGTTIMQFTVIQARDIVRNWHIPMVTYAALDRRAPAEQRDNPWVDGELVSFDGKNSRESLLP
jgi:CRISPR-associated DxTHG motif protein